MTDQHEPIFYPYSLFPPRASEAFPEHAPSSYTNTMPHSDSSVPGWNTTPSESNHLVFCPSCSSPASENVNWCSSCGELLIGARLSSHELGGWSLGGHPFRVSQNASSVPEWYSTDASQRPTLLRTSYTYQETHPHFVDCTSYSQRTASAVALSPIGSATSLAMASSFSPPFFSTVAIEREDFSVPLTQQTNPPYHVAETSVLYGASQMESLRSYFGEFHLSAGLPASLGSSRYINNDSSDQMVPALNTAVGTLQRTASSYPDSTKDIHLAHQMCRQRCTSGPVPGCVMAAERGYFSDVHQLECPPMMHQLRDIESHGSFCDSQTQYKPYVKQNFSMLPEHYTTSLHTFFPSSDRKSSVACRSSVFSNRSRRKHPSECSVLQPSPLSIGQNAPAMEGSGSRSRSFSSTTRVSNPSALSTTEESLAEFHWNSSRTAWSAHFPQLAKKKSAAYLRASCSRSHQLSQNRRLQPNAGASDSNVRLVSSAQHPVSYSDDQLHFRAKPSTQSSTTSRAIYYRDCEKSKRKPKRRATKRLNSDPTALVPLAVTCASPNVDDDSTATCAHSSDPAGHVTEFDDPVSATSSPNWMLLPNELWIAVMRFLAPRDRAHLALVCRRLSALLVDPSLWRIIQLHRHQHLTDSALASIGRLRPRDLRFSYCHGSGIAEEGLRHLFKTCGSSLHKLSFVGCTKGPFDGDLTLLLAAQHCPNLDHVDASYTLAVRDHTVIALAKSAQHLLSVKLNGAQHISNSAIQQLVHYHKETLQRLELFGCFRLNSDIFTLLSRCQQLRALAFGHLHHLSSDGLLELVGKLPLLASLDLRGTQTLANDTNLSHLADKCPHLEEVVLANMHSVKHEAGVAQMLRRLPRLRVLDLCGLVAVGDMTMEALATGCPQLEELDVSCTSVTHTGLFHLTRAPAKCLRCLRISHCREITKDVLEKLVEACTNLTLIHAYGFKSIKDWSFLQKIRPALHVECDG